MANMLNHTPFAVTENDVNRDAIANKLVALNQLYLIGLISELVYESAVREIDVQASKLDGAVYIDRERNGALRVVVGRLTNLN